MCKELMSYPSFSVSSTGLVLVQGLLFAGGQLDISCKATLLSAVLLLPPNPAS